MSDRPSRQDADAHVDTPAAIRLPVSMRLTKEQLAAAERTKDYHLRKLHGVVLKAQRSDEAATGREH